MTIDTKGLVEAMISAGENLGSALLKQGSTFAIPEFTKIATQVAAIELHVDTYTKDGARALLNMQVSASVGVIVAMTTLMLLDAQNALNAILQAVKTTINQAVGFALVI